MTNEEQLEKDLIAFKKAAKAYTKKHTKTKEDAMKALIKSGIYTKSGKLSKNYR